MCHTMQWSITFVSPSYKNFLNCIKQIQLIGKEILPSCLKKNFFTFLIIIFTCHTTTYPAYSHKVGQIRLNFRQSKLALLSMDIIGSIYLKEVHIIPPFIIRYKRFDFMCFGFNSLVFRIVLLFIVCHHFL